MVITGRQKTLDVLAQEREAVEQHFDVRSLAVFGSVGRDEDTVESDVDVLVEFDGPATFDRFFGLKAYLEERLGRSVDLVTQPAIRDELRPHIERDVVHVARVAPVSH
jgi:predicted nucleotidyltransferase